ncbi:MAG: EamA family transporter [Candidatus Heimdallarchaeota archaeon]|nr:EamA family transporter [Candidatus Heimdallarchaeota archaeon]
MALIDYIGEIAAIAGAICFGLANVIIKSQSGKIKPIAINALRLSMTSIIFIILLSLMGLLKDAFSLGWSISLLLVGGSIAGLVLGDMIFFFSQRLIGLSRAYPIAVSYPLLTYVFGMIFLDEQFHWLRMLGVIVVVIGVYLVARSTKKSRAIKKDPLEEQSTEITGDETETNCREIELSTREVPKSHQKASSKREETNLLEEKEQEENNPLNEASTNSLEAIDKKQFALGILGAILTAILWTTGTLLMDAGLTDEINRFSANGLRMICITPFAIILFLLLNRGKYKSEFSWKGVIFVLVAGLIGNTIGSLLYIFALAYTAASTTAAVTAAAPLVATPLSVLFLHEKVTWLLAVGTLLTIGGIWLIILF